MRGGRRELHLGEPPQPERLRRFPAWRWRAGTPLVRLHRVDRGPWFFSSGGEGRFDLGGGAGTCYLATSPEVSFVEVFYGFAIVSLPDLERYRLSQLALAEPVRMADCTSSRAAAFGVTAEIATTARYDLTEHWAGALAAGGFAGIRYFARHDPGRGRAVALFGPAGDQTATYPAPVSTQEIDAPLRRRLTRRYGVVFLGTDV